MDQPAQIITEPPPPVSVNLQPSSPVPKSKKGPLVILLVISGLILAGGLVYAGMQIGKKQSQISSLPTPIPTEVLIPTIIPSPTEIVIPTTFVSTPTPDPTAGWKTYTNGTEKYRFKYPQNWFLKESSSMVQIFNYDVDNAPGRAYDPSRDGNLFKIEIFMDDKYSDVDKWFNDEKSRMSPVTNKPYEFLNAKPVTVDSQKGIYFEVKDEWTDISVGTVVFQSPKNKLIRFNGGLNYPDNKGFFDQVLATFKFLD